MGVEHDREERNHVVVGFTLLFDKVNLIFLTILFLNDYCSH